MPFLDATILNDLQAKEATNEKFIANYGMIDLAKDSGQAIDYIPPDVRQALSEMSASRGQEIPVIKDQSVTVHTTAGFNYIPTNLAETDTYGFTAFDVFSGFRFFPAAFGNNMVRAEFYRDQTIMNIMQACAVEIDNIIETQFESRKTQLLDFTTQISQGDGTFTFNGTTDTLEINKAAQKETMWYNMTQLMLANQLPGMYRTVTSPAGLVASDVSGLIYQNQQSKYLEWQNAYMPQGNRYISNQIATAANFNGFLVRDGDIGLIENFPWDFRNGTNFAGKRWSVSDVELPFVKLRANIYVNNEATDASSVLMPSTDTNLKMTHFEEMAFWFRFYIPYRYNSDLTARQNGIVKLLGQTS